MEFFGPRLEGAIVVVGNAPTALWKVLAMAQSGAARPALVIGLPVGFVGARESKAALLESDLVYITNVGPRGGSPVAAAALNALASLPEEE
jgi:precorrin-8X/cobalt-precorrin-8 methylmutase